MVPAPQRLEAYVVIGENVISVFNLLGISEEQLPDYSVRLNSYMGGVDVIDAYYNRRDKLLEHAHTVQWPGKQRRNISTPYVLQFLQLRENSREHWLFIGGSRILPGEVLDSDGRGAKIANYEVMEEFKPYEARLVAKYKRKQGSSGAGGLTPNMAKPGTREHLVSNMVVDYIAQSAISAIPFPGYEQVRLSFAELKAAVSNSEWRASLNSVSAVYLLTDRSNGWHYVGSAYSRKGSDQGLLSRWTEYTQGDHTGGNKGLRKYTTPEEIERYFQYTILEIFDRRAKASDVIQREHWWMDTLQSVHTKDHPFGYNTISEREENAG